MPGSSVRELTLEVPIGDQPLLAAALSHVRVVQVLEFRSSGFVLLCTASREGAELLRETLARAGPPGLVVTVLGRDRTGSETLQLSGGWVDSELSDQPARRRTMRFFRSMERAPFYSLGMTFEGSALRVSIMAHQRLIRRLLDGLEDTGVPHRVLKLARPRARTDPILGSLTARQRSVLGLAHALGYYDVPRRARTEDLARLMRMDRGTVGEHLRRAEKRVFDGLLRS
ncbi:MAG: helix-turn-helix domain-containing protein [Nitrososphaerales archaeon]|jgi:hypothetical protein